MKAVLLSLIVALGCSLGLPAHAAWNSAAETIDKHPVWIYKPVTTMANGKHGLLIVLHGCAQTHDEIKNFGNLEATANNNAIVIAVPYVGPRVWQGNSAAKCWDYDGALDKQGHISEIVKIATTLKARAGLDIDPAHVYVAGLSSGGALALDVACHAPDIFAGVAAKAAPSPGSSQLNATAQAPAIPADNVERGVRTCTGLAGDRVASFATQTAVIAAGSMDLNGPNERYRFNAFLSEADKAAHAGQWALVSTRWSQDNVRIFQRIYETEELGGNEAVQGDFGVQQLARKNGKPRIAWLMVNNVGHAWPAGTGRPNSPPPDGLWIAQSGLTYPDHIVSWLIANNLRASMPAGPELTVLAVVEGSRVAGSGTVRKRDGGRATVATSLLKGDSNQSVDSHPAVEVNPDGSFSDTYSNVQNGKYKLQASARDDAGNTSTTVSNEVMVGPTPPAVPCYIDNNYRHVRSGRAHLCSSGYACANGSGENLGLFSLFITSSIVEDPAGFFRKGACAVR